MVTTATSATLPIHDRVDGVPVTRVFVRARSVASRLRAIAGMVRHVTAAMRAVDLVHVQGFSEHRGRSAGAAVWAARMSTPLKPRSLPTPASRMRPRSRPARQRCILR